MAKKAKKKKPGPRKLLTVRQPHHHDDLEAEIRILTQAVVDRQHLLMQIRDWLIKNVRPE